MTENNDFNNIENDSTISRNEKRFTTQRIYKGFDGEKIYEWCVMDYDNVLLRLTTRMDCKDVCEELNNLHEEKEELIYALNQRTEQCDKLHEENQKLSKDKQLAETTLMNYKQRVKDELEMRYCLSNHKPVFDFMAKKLDITLEGNVE